MEDSITLYDTSLVLHHMAWNIELSLKNVYETKLALTHAAIYRAHTTLRNR